MPYKKKSSHHRHCTHKKTTVMWLWLCSLLLYLSSLPRGFYWNMGLFQANLIERPNASKYQVPTVATKINGQVESEIATP